MTAFLLAVTIDAAVMACLALFTIWEHRRYHAREDAHNRRLEVTRKRAAVGDDVDEAYRTAVIAVWGSRPRPVGIQTGQTNA